MTSDAIQQAVERFVAELKAILAEEAKAALLAALTGEQPTRRVPSAAPTGPRGRKPAAAPARKAKAGKRGRRSSEDLEAIQEQILVVLRRQPGANSEELQTALGMSKQDVQRPLQLLRDEERVQTEGERRGMRYYVRGS